MPWYSWDAVNLQPAKQPQCSWIFAGALAATKCQLSGWDVSRDTIANIELRRRRVADFAVVMLARVLGVAVSDLLPKRLNDDDIPVRRRR
jgi:uncharacterized membrane-anchored protein